MSIKTHLTTAAALVACQLAMGQRDSIPKQLDEVVVTATKYPIKLSETGKVLTVVTHEQIEQSGGKDLAQVLTEQAGIIVNGSYSNPSKDKSLYLLGASNDFTLILLDGIPINDPSGAGGVYDMRLIPLNEIERIEILKGSQSTLYGSDAVAGVINIITRKDSNKKFGVTGGLSYGSYNTFNGDIGFHGKASIFDYNVHYGYASTTGISEATDTTGHGNFDKDGSLTNNFQANVNIRPTKNLSISPFYRYTYFNGDYDAGAFTDAPYHSSYLMNNAGLIAKYNLPNGVLNANYGYTYSMRTYTGDLIYRGQFHDGEVYLAQSLNKWFKLLAGISYQSYQLIDSTSVPKNAKTDIVSPYASLSLVTQNGFSAEGGLRLDAHSRFGNFLTYNLNTSYLIEKQLKLFANLSTGFKAPTVNQLYGQYGANLNLQPQRSVSIEAGLQFSTTDKKLQITGIYYNRVVNDLITYIDTIYINVNKQKNHGVELDLIYRPTSRLNVHASYSYSTGSLFLTNNGKDSSFYNLIRIPKNTLNASVGYQVSTSLYASVSFQTLGKRSDLYFENAPPYGTEQVSLAAYGLLNAYAEYKFAKNAFKVFVDLKNITNTKFTEVYGYNTIGFTITGGLRINL